MKPLKPSHREHKRYLLLSGKDANSQDIDKAILSFIGILGYAKASPQIIKDAHNKHKNKIILAVNRRELDKIKASLVLSGKDISVEKISGIIGKF
jgi:RNase P/RNase MRP subunit POP5